MKKMRPVKAWNIVDTRDGRMLDGPYYKRKHAKDLLRPFSFQRLTRVIIREIPKGGK